MRKTTFYSAIFVATKLNPSGKFYNIAMHPDTASINPVYGDEPDEIGNTGINYIFDNALKLTVKARWLHIAYRG